MRYISALEASKKWGLTKRRVLTLCKEGRVNGAELIGSSWVIPEENEKPTDKRTTRYSKVKLDQKKTPIHSSVKAEAHTPQYKMHKYFARRPYNVFQHLIHHYTSRGDIILDPFCGGGTTIFESAAAERKAIGIDINPLASFITRMQLFTGNVEELDHFFNRFLLTVNKKYKDYYKVVFNDDEGIALWTEWVYRVKCPHCGSIISLSDDNKLSNGIYRCNDTSCEGYLSGVRRVDCIPFDSVPIRVKYVSERTGKTLIRAISEANNIYDPTELERLIDSLEYHPNFEIPENWDRQHEDKLKEKGVTTYRDFFTKRNYVINCLIFNEIMELKKNSPSYMNEYLYFLFSSSLRYTNNMTRVTENWENGNPTSMDKHAFWLPNQYVETNVLDILSQRKSTIIKGCKYAKTKLPSDLIEVSCYEDLLLHNGYLVLNQSSTNLPFPDKCVDIILTDPPYGSNVQYAELSTIWNAWFAEYKKLDSYIFNDEEAIVNRKRFDGAKDESTYENLLFEVFSEGNRVLKDDGYLVFTFNNKNINVWISMLKAVAAAGFYLPDDGLIFQDYVQSYKNTAHLRFSGNIHGDFICSFRKGKPIIDEDASKPISLILEETIHQTIARLYRKRKQYTTPELYQKVLSVITSEIMKHIVWCKKNGCEMQGFTALSNNYVDNELKKYLVMSEGRWVKK